MVVAGSILFGIKNDILKHLRSEVKRRDEKTLANANPGQRSCRLANARSPQFRAFHASWLWFFDHKFVSPVGHLLAAIFIVAMLGCVAESTTILTGSQGCNTASDFGSEPKVRDAALCLIGCFDQLQHSLTRTCDLR